MIFLVGYRDRIDALKPLKRQRILKNIYVLDIETEEWIDDTYGLEPDDVIETWHNKPIPAFLLVFYDHTEKQVLYYDEKDCVKKFLKDYLVKAHRNQKVYAHTGGRFDFLKIYETLKRDKYFKKFLPEIRYAHGKIMQLIIRDKHNNIWNFRDSWLLLQDSLDNLCKGFKPQHKKLVRPPYPYKKYKKQWMEYCVNDCLALAEILDMFNKTISDLGGCIGATIASTAMMTFRKRFLKQDLPTYFEWNDFIKKGYYGGRVEIFNMYAMECGKPYYYYDCNSEFPSVMYSNIFPVSKPRRVCYKEPDDCIGKCGIMECKVKAPPDLDIPLLPFRSPDGKLLFPLGTWTGAYEFSLIEKALLYGYEIKPLRTIEFKGEPLFKDYVGTLYPLKQQAEDGAMRETIKYLLNSLYGKFAERPNWEEVITDPKESMHGALPFDNEFGYCLKKTFRNSAYHLPAISARVTALAQLKLYEMFEKIQRIGGTVYYCDTDSVITDVILPTSSELGDWKRGVKAEDKQNYDLAEAVFLAPKAYCLKLYKTDQECRTVMKGFSKYMKKHMTIQDFINALPPKNILEPFIEYRVQPASFKEIAVRNLDGFCTIVKPRSIQQIYNKREILNDLSTKPLQVIDGVIQWKEPPMEIAYSDFEWGH